MAVSAKSSLENLSPLRALVHLPSGPRSSTGTAVWSAMPPKNTAFACSKPRKETLPLCHLPVPNVAYPASRRTSGRSFWPVIRASEWSQCLPVMSIWRLGTQTAPEFDPKQ